MQMMSDKASSFPPVKTSWMRVAQRTLELFTHVRSTGEKKRAGRWGLRLSPPWWATAKSSLSCRRTASHAAIRLQGALP